MSIKTKMFREQDIEHSWLLVDANGAITGRLAAWIAYRLRGCHMPMYTPHVLCSPHIVVVNAGKICITGKKYDEKIYYRHTGYPGGIRSTTPRDVLAGPHPEKMLRGAVKKMLPKGPLARRQLKYLYIYPENEHPHSGQKPEVIDFLALSPKNSMKR